jgi:hypothetical protein
MDRYHHLIAPETFTHDSEVRIQVRATEAPGLEPIRSIEVPERLMERFVALGRAYGLPVVALLAASFGCELNGFQAGELCSEIDFIAGTVDDPALLVQLGPLREMAETCSLAHHDLDLWVGWP